MAAARILGAPSLASIDAMVGFVVLGETIAVRALFAMVLIIVASCGVSFLDKQ